YRFACLPDVALVFRVGQLHYREGAHLAEDVLVDPSWPLRNDDKGHPELPSLPRDFGGDVLGGGASRTLARDEDVCLLDRTDDRGLEPYLPSTACIGIAAHPHCALPVLKDLLEIVGDRCVSLPLGELEHVEGVDLRDAYLVEDLADVWVDDRFHPAHRQFND